MKYPNFFNNIETIKLKDDLSDFLGAFEDGIVEFTYLDIVKCAGHSCPTVAGAYLMAREALKVLFRDSIAKRGEIVVEFKEDIEEGVAGVVANVISNITGATSTDGFKGIGGRFSRCDLMFFNTDITSSVRFSTIDSSKSVDVYYHAARVYPEEKQSELLQKIKMGLASKEEIKEFGILWQKRVENIFLNVDDVIEII
ncbi:MAG: hypothetical protein PQJ44_07440 [Sphaerochaetaceae bacterium]|nr:hypothetical protein [Sphaerochaetaceae bacterium]